MNYRIKSIRPSLLLLLFVGVASARYISFYDDDKSLLPIVTSSQERRICAELCLSGLGGAACGADCIDIIPQGLPLQSAASNKTVASDYGQATRHDACGVLCDNQLGYPLCNCEKYNETQKTSTDFVEVCSLFCLKFDYQIYGCQNCSLYTNLKKNEFLLTSSQQIYAKSGVDWGLWCQKMCSGGDGGAACNCDLLPMSIVV